MSEPGPTVFNGRYALLRHLARGGMADVYLARDALLDRQVALKVLFPEYADEPSFVERFRREAQAAANLNHPHIVGVYDWGQERGTYYLVMEYVEGRSMADVLRSTGPLHPDRAAEIGAAVADALGTAHKAGLVHRDVKLGNILVNDDGTVKVADFGIATALVATASDNLTRAGSVLGTATYFSPEQAQGKTLSGQSDLYSLGIVLYEMVTGRPPFVADNPTAVALKQVQERPVPPNRNGANIAESLQAIILKLLAKDPSLRYPAAADLVADLQRYLAGAHQIPSRKPTAPSPATAQGPVAQGSAAQGPAALISPSPAPAAAPRRPVATPPPGPAVHRSPPAGTRSDQQPAPLMPSRFDQQVAPGSPPAGTRFHQPPVPPAAPYPPAYYYGEPSGDGWKRTALMLVLLTGLVAVLGALVVAFYRNLDLGGSDDPASPVEPPPAEVIEMPSLNGLSLSGAEDRLRDLGLRIEVDYRVNTSIPEDTVFDQSPPAGQRVDESDAVTLVVSRGETPKVPPVRGRTREQATQRLMEAGYVVIPITAANQAEAGTVIGQDPIGGTELSDGEAVTITVSTGPGQVFVPDVRNVSQLTAFNQLAEAGFRVGEKREAHETVEEGLVIDTDPTAGTPLAPNNVVTVIVSTGLPALPMPDVQGLLFDTGKLNLEREGLTIGSVTFRPVEAGSTDIGRILAQVPAPGQQVRQGDPVDVVVGEPPGTSVDPDEEPEETPTTEEPVPDPEGPETTEPPDTTEPVDTTEPAEN